MILNIPRLDSILFLIYTYTFILKRSLQRNQNLKILQCFCLGIAKKCMLDKANLIRIWYTMLYVSICIAAYSKDFWIYHFVLVISNGISPLSQNFTILKSSPK